MKNSFQTKAWWSFLGGDLQELLGESQKLLQEASSWQTTFHDYSFIVFPAAKAYEGFLKKVFLNLGFISEEDYFGNRFRIGKALNPSLDPKYKDENVYEKVVKFCEGKNLADEMWNAWKLCRNQVFHWFPNEKNNLTYSQAGERIALIIKTMDDTFKGCKIKR